MTQVVRLLCEREDEMHPTLVEGNERKEHETSKKMVFTAMRPSRRKPEGGKLFLTGNTCSCFSFWPAGEKNLRNTSESSLDLPKISAFRFSQNVLVTVTPIPNTHESWNSTSLLFWRPPPHPPGLCPVSPHWRLGRSPNLLHTLCCRVL